MNFNEHSRLEGLHAFLSASKYHWVNYDEEKLLRAYASSRAAQIGSEKHDLAKQLIKLKQKLPDTGQTLNMFVNDAIGFRMRPEQVLFVSSLCFGTADAIGFTDMILRISDYKSGVTPASVKQLEIYAAMFCLEYGYKPAELEGIELRIYQHDDVYFYEGDVDVITHIMDKIVTSDRILREARMEDM